MLPEEFTKRMKDLLGDEYKDYEKSLEGPMIKALRLNPLKGGEAQLLDLCKGTFGDAFEPVPWEPNGYYYPVDDTLRPGISPLHEAGAYYIQEPSAMKPVTCLDVKPGLKVLDLCAAPGGKSSQIAGYMQGRGLLVCNEPVGKRASILSSNIERMGIKNALVLNETPERLRDRFAGFFDRILVDAPCSGEGMFRKNEEEALREWSLQNVAMCAARQGQILDDAAFMLKAGGLMVYSTCTFSHEEDEGCIEGFLKRHPDFDLITQEKLFPHKVKGEGHFMAVLGKGYKEDYICADADSGAVKSSPVKNKGRGKDKDKNKAGDLKLEAYDDFCRDMFGERLRDDEEHAGGLTFFGDNLYLLPDDAPDLFGLKVQRPGLQLGSLKGDVRKGFRFEPSHALALALKKDETKKSVNITSREAENYIQGMTLTSDSSLSGWVLVCVEGLSLGWGKLVNGVIKNHYPKGIRRNLSAKQI